MNFKKLKTTTALSAIAGSILFYHASTSEAQTTSSAVLAVSASIASSCTISAAALGFGAYVDGANSTSSANITATCTNGTGYTILFNDTPDSAGIYRIYSGGATSATTSLFLESSFGATSGFSLAITNTANAISGTGNGSAQTIPIYGKIASGQITIASRVSGAYSRNLTLNLVYS
jgi:spore coat protein U-like protein